MQTLLSSSQTSVWYQNCLCHRSNPQCRMSCYEEKELRPGQARALVTTGNGPKRPLNHSLLPCAAAMCVNVA